MTPSDAPHRIRAFRARMPLPWLLVIALGAGFCSRARADCDHPSPLCPDLCLPPLCNSIDEPYLCRPPLPPGDYDLVGLEYLGYRPKDFTLIVAGGQYHVFFTLQHGMDDTSSTRFGHDVSSDLVHWTTLPPVVPARPGAWDAAHVWSPHVIERNGTFDLFYTGVDSAGKQSIGLATSTDLLEWKRLDHPVFSCEQVSWSWCDASDPNGRDFRDPFVMPDPDSTGRWMMIYSTRLADTTAVPGVALSAGDLTAWRDAGPLWRSATNWWDDARTFESPHLFQHDGTWFLFYTTSAGQPLEFQTTRGSPRDSLGWHHWNRLANLDCVDIGTTIASEYLHDPLHGEDLFCDGAYNRIEIRGMRWWQDSTYFSLLRPADRIPPGAVTDLRATTGRTTAVLHWTSPGGDGSEGRATLYEVRYSPAPLGEEALMTTGLRATTSLPDTAGKPECLEIRDLSPATRYWFALRSYDSAGNASAVSNVVTLTTRDAHGDEVMCGYDDARPEPPFVAPGPGDENGGTPASDSSRASAAVTMLQPVYPNPARGGATLHFDLPRPAVLTVEIFEPTGRRVRMLTDAWQAAGSRSLPWDGRDASGVTLPPGVYLYRWSAGAARGRGKLELVR